MDERLMEIIVCPSCRKKLIYDTNQEKLRCEECKLEYNIKDGIPILIIEEAERL